MQATNRKAILVMCAALTVGLMSVSWMGCASTSTRESTGEYVDDSTITSKVKTAFATDPMVSMFDVHVKTYKYVVTLGGHVTSQAAKDRAEETARSVHGVKSVINNLTVKP